MNQNGEQLACGLAIVLRGVIVAVLLVAMTQSGPLAAQGSCDCSCEAFAKTKKALKQYSATGDSANIANMPPETMQMMRCSGVCTPQWQNCEGPKEDSKGRSQASAPPAGLPKEQLAPDYLEGTWCSVYGGQETTEWLFHADGSYQIGVPAGGDYAIQPNVQSLEQFRNRFERLIEFNPNTFTTLHQHGRKNVFERGDCR